jgi:hypothetical protein
MTREDLERFHEEVCSEARAVLGAKNNDYANPRGNPNPMAPFKNFMMCEHMDVARAEVGIFIRMMDKFSRLSSFLSEDFSPEVDEDLGEVIRDMLNYGILILALRKARSDLN